MSGRDPYAQARLAGEEAMGAELLAGRELLTLAGIGWATAEGMARIAAEQAGYWFDDQRRTFEQMTGDAQPARATDLLADHAGRRLAHLMEGADQFNRLLFEQTREACRTAATLWTPYLAVLRRDWGAPPPDP